MDGVPGSMKVLAVHADTGPHKMLPDASWRAVLDPFLERHDDYLVFAVGASERIGDEGPHADRIVPCYGLPFAVSLALIAEADLFAGIDSCMLHAADLFGVPGVGVLGPHTNPAEFGFRFGPHRHVACDDLDELPAAVVVDALEDLLAGRSEAACAAPRRAPRAALSARSTQPLPTAARARLREARRPLVLCSGGFGDQLLFLPAVRAVAHLYPGRASVTVRPEHGAILHRDLDLDTSILDDFSGKGIGAARRLEHLPGRVRDCDAVLSLNYWESENVDSLLEALGDVPSLGFGASFRRALAPGGTGTHITDQAFSIVRALDPSLRVEDFAWPLRHDERCRAAALGAIRDGLGTRPLLGLHVDTSAAKRIPTRTWSAFLEVLLERRPELGVLVLGASDPGLRLPRFADRILSCIGAPLATSVALVAQCRVFAGIDSCLVHVADLERIPSVAVFGPTDPDVWGLRFAPHRHLACEPCFPPRNEVAATRILAAVEELLDEPAAERFTAPSLQAPEPRRSVSPPTRGPERVALAEGGAP